MARRDNKGTDHLMYAQIGQEINDVETNMEDVKQLYGLRACARSGRADSNQDNEGQDLSQQWHAWAVRMRQSNEGCRRQNANTCGG